MNENIKEKLLVQLEEADVAAADQHPSCPHGPTVLFYRQSQSPTDGFFGCAAHRNPKLCDFRINRLDWQRKQLNRRPEVIPYPHARCERDVDPTSHLEALSQDDVHAQYFFDTNALRFFEIQCEALKINKVICMGTPRLHFHLRLKKNIASFLLDFDERFASYLDAKEFCLYNMCNNHFFYARQPFEQFLECADHERVLIVTDPPFGCRTELIANTLRSLGQLHNRINQIPATPLAIFWVYPYYMANYIQQEMPQLQICDYKLNYTNHSRYTNVGASRRCHGSPVRVFTNVPLQQLQLRQDEGYKYCKKCERFTAVENVHCERCGSCCALNGQTYRHCNLCDLCVKPNYVHCSSCRRCCQVEGHNCELYQSKQLCWLCGERGHVESNCPVWLKLRLKRRLRLQTAGCLICGQKHSERKCKLRSRYFKETQFMGQTTITPRKN